MSPNGDLSENTAFSCSTVTITPLSCGNHEKTAMLHRFSQFICLMHLVQTLATENNAKNSADISLFEGI